MINGNHENTYGAIKVERPNYQQEQLNRELSYSKPIASPYRYMRQKYEQFNAQECLLSMFPIIGWLSQYKIRDSLLGDIISGCTVAVMHIPQGMGYAMLAGLPPIIGIYTAFFPVIIYFILGTSRHNSMGTFAVICLMASKPVLQLSDINLEPLANVPADGVVTTRYSAAEVVAALCLLIGLIQIGMYILRLGVVSTLLSETLVSGFTTGAAIHVLTSQIKDLLGIKMKSTEGNFQVILNYIEMGKGLTVGNFNWAAIIISIITVTILLINNELLKPYVAKKCVIPVPIELIVVVAGTLFSKYLYLNDIYGVSHVGHIPTGFPNFKIPSMELFSELALDSFIIAMVSYTVSVSMALIFAQKLNYEIDFNQELLAMGAGNVFGSFFACIPLSASLSRSTIQQTVGGNTQIASIISCSLLAIVLLWVGPFFEPLPKCALASIIVVALKGMLMQVKDFMHFWKLSQLDAFVWIATFLAVVVVAIDIGLAVGIALSLSSIFVRGMKPYTCLLGNVPKTDLYLDINRYRGTEEIPNLKIFHYCGSLNFASRNFFKSELCSQLNIDLSKEIRRKMKASQKQTKYIPLDIKTLIIDFSALSYIDPSSVISIKSLINDFKKLTIYVYIAGCSCPVYEIMQKCGLIERESELFKFFPTVHDAVFHTSNLPLGVITDENYVLPN